MAQQPDSKDMQTVKQLTLNIVHELSFREERLSVAADNFCPPYVTLALVCNCLPEIYCILLATAGSPKT